MKKGVCPYCHKPLDVDEEQQIEKCPYCEKEIYVAQSQKLYGMFYTQYLTNGNIALNASRDYRKALVEYDKLLSLDGGSTEAIFGRALALVSTSLIGESNIRKALDFLKNNEEKIFANTELYSEIAANLILFGKRVDEYLDGACSHLSKDEIFLDQESLACYQKIASEAFECWLYIRDVFTRFDLDESDDERDYMKERISSLKNLNHDLPMAQVSIEGGHFYERVERQIFDTRVGLYKARIVLGIMQIVFVIGAIIGFAIMMADYQNNPLPGLIVFAVFAFLFIAVNIANRIIKKKLSV
ncbi:MAG: hypothetical protein WC282_01370 [Bacilli bacterium]|jgi:uncharacterized protein YbaR (Trm112 family)